MKNVTNGNDKHIAQEIELKQCQENLNEKDNVNVSFPQNWKFVANTIRNNDRIKESLLIYTVTWNLKGRVPKSEELKILLPKLQNKNQSKLYHMYVISTQECMRSILSSFFNSNKDKWIQMLQ